MKRGKRQLMVLGLVVVFLITAAYCQAERLVVPIPDKGYVLDARSSGHISIEGYGYAAEPGTPKLPGRIYAIALPPGAVPDEVIGHLGEPQRVSQKISIEPVPVFRVIGDENPELYKKDQARYLETYRRIYQSDQPYPQKPVTFVRRAHFRRYNLVDVRVVPFQYYPLTEELLYYPDISIEIRYHIEPDQIDERLLTDALPRMEARARSLILNYDQAQAWYPADRAVSRGLHDYVIITTSALVDSVSELVSWEEMKGRTVEVVTVEWISSTYSGADLAQKMRNFLLDKYPASAWGIEDVCLIGHHSDVPMRIASQDIGYGKPRTDYYFAELSLPDDQSWDSNHNGNYMDPGDNIDFYSEVNVGRFPWSEPTTVAHICEKSVAFEVNMEESFKRNILFLGAYFWSNTDNAVLMEAIASRPWMSDWSKTRMYEQNSDYYSSYACDYELLHSNVMDVWPDGSFAVVNWAGHGSPTSSHILGLGAPAFISSSDCSQLNDDYPAIIFADACSNSDTNVINIGASMLKQGGVGFVGATKVAFGVSGWSMPEDGSTQSLDYYFITGVTSTDYTQGAAHQHALEEVYQMSGFYRVKYEYAEWTIWGNPDLSVGEISISDGIVSMDKDMYAPGQSIHVTVRDSDLNVSPSAAEQVDVALTTSGGDVETMHLTETGPSTGIFSGAIAIEGGSAVSGNNKVDVAHGDVITVTYVDADDGQGGSNVEKTDTAQIDAMPPEISNVRVTDVTYQSMVIEWTTDEPSTSVVTYGPDIPDTVVSDDTLTTMHSIRLNGLEECTYYRFSVSSSDAVDNQTTDNNNGAYYAEMTWEIVEAMSEDLSTDPGWTISGGQWAFGVPQGQGGSEHGFPDPTSGHTGQNVYGYNLNGDYTNSMPAYNLTTTAIDCSDVSGATLSFWRWLGVERNEYDHAAVKVSNDGQNWTTIWENPDIETADHSWIYQEFDISDVADGQSTVYIRWVMGRTDGGWVYCGWNIDDVKILSSQPCNSGPTPTPFPTFTPTPTPTQPHETIGIDLRLNKLMYSAGDIFLLTAECYNPYPEVTLVECIILDVYGQYFFWPHWEETWDYRLVAIPSGGLPPETILEFTWPDDVAGSATGLRFWGALLAPGSYELVGEYDMVEFGYH